MTTRKKTNDTKIHPVHFNVLIRLDPVPTVTSGGVEIPDQSVQRSQMAQTAATLLACGARTFEDWEDDPKPKVGDRVLVQKYAAEPPRPGDLEDLVRVCKDKAIAALLDEDYDARINVKPAS